MIVPVLAIALGEADLETAVSRSIPTLEPVLRTRLLEALTEIASEFKDQFPGARVEARLAGDEVELVYLQNESVTRETPSELNARKIPTATGGEWSATQVNRVLARL